MAKKKRTTKKAAASGGLSRLQQETVSTVIQPILYELIEQHQPTLTGLLALFRKETGEKTSMATLRLYLKHLGWTYQRVPTWTGLPEMLYAHSGPAPDQMELDQSLDPDTASDGPAFDQIDPLSALTH